jgi:hypothetical protein
LKIVLQATARHPGEVGPALHEAEFDWRLDRRSPFFRVSLDEKNLLSFVENNLVASARKCVPRLLEKIPRFVCAQAIDSFSRTLKSTAYAI